MRYVKETFDVYNIEQAKHVVLTSDPKNPNKFQEETDYFINIFRNSGYISSNSKVLDFGCGMGRISKELINTFNCDVIGVDISDSMLRFADLYVSNPKKFKGVKSYTEPESINIAFCILVLQHAEDPQKEIDNLYDVIVPNGYLVLVNENKRLVPSDVDKNGYVIWYDDRFDVQGAIHKKFKQIESRRYLNTDIEILLFQKTNYVPTNFNYTTNAF